MEFPIVHPQNFHPPKSFALSRFTFRSTGLTNNEITLTFGKERRNELVSNTARTSGSFDCWHFDPGDAKASVLHRCDLDVFTTHHHSRSSWPHFRPIVGVEGTQAKIMRY